jgi:regulatory protein
MEGERIMKDGQKKQVKPAFDEAADFLSRRMRTEWEVRGFLNGRSVYDADEIDDAMGRLSELKYIDDGAYAARYLETLIDKKRGRLRIRNEMRRRGLAAGLIEEALTDGYPERDERENAIRLASKILDAMPEGADAADARKAARRISSRLAAQGYDYELIGAVVSELISI